MSLTKAIEHGKEHRKPWRGARAWDTRCRSHGGCKCCKMVRAYKERRRMKGVDTMPDHSTYRGIPIWFEGSQTVFVWDGLEIAMPTQPMALKWIDEHMEEAGGDGYK